MIQSRSDFASRKPKTKHTGPRRFVMGQMNLGTFWSPKLDANLRDISDSHWKTLYEFARDLFRSTGGSFAWCEEMITAISLTAGNRWWLYGWQLLSFWSWQLDVLPASSNWFSAGLRLKFSVATCAFSRWRFHRVTRRSSSGIGRWLSCWERLEV